MFLQRNPSNKKYYYVINPHKTLIHFVQEKGLWMVVQWVIETAAGTVYQ